MLFLKNHKQFQSEITFLYIFQAFYTRNMMKKIKKNVIELKVLFFMYLNTFYPILSFGTFVWLILRHCFKKV